MNRKHSPLHDKWHKRVEGQIRHTMGRHPEWFNIKSKGQQKTIVNSLAKRIVGEIVADIRLAQSSQSCRYSDPELTAGSSGTNAARSKLGGWPFPALRRLFKKTVTHLLSKNS